ncbi:hypothetical protein GYA49_04945 [Candidatus Beckwithbacteria bacterium]|nr:hypothetical protein [Candidatus Beckwithbacteria bacterium]
MNDHYTFLKIDPNTYRGEYDAYFQRASEYITNVIMLTNSLILILITCFIELGIGLPKDSMVGTFIRIIRDNKKSHPKLSKLLHLLHNVNKIVNQTKHSLIGINENPNETGIIFWDLKEKKMQTLTHTDIKANLATMSKAIKMASEILKSVQEDHS